MKYKYLKFKIIVPSVLFILLVIFLCLFFFGGLKAKATTFDNEDFDSSLEGYIDFYPLSDQDKSLFEKKIVGQNKKFVMVFDEATTIVSVYANDANFNISDLDHSTFLYATASLTEDKYRTNFILTYVDENGKFGELNAYDKSVQYNNITTGLYERHYKVKYDEESNSVDVYYDIGEFAPYVFPKQYNYYDFTEKFIGNTIFFLGKTGSSYNYNNIQVLDEDGNPIELTRYLGTDKVTSTSAYELKFSRLIVIDKEAMKYILNNKLGSILIKNVRYSELTSDVEKYIDESKSYFLVDDLYDENGNMKLKVGVNYNCEGSPIKINPFTFFELLKYEIISYYKMRTTDENDQNIDRNWPDNIFTLDQYKDVYFNLDGDGLNALSAIAKKTLYNQLYVGNFRTDADGVITFDDHPYFDSLQDSRDLKGFEVFFDYNGDGEITADEFFRYGGCPATNEDGSYVYDYDEDGNIVRCKQFALTTEEAVEQNEKYNNYDNSSKIVYGLNIRFSLTNDGLDVELLNNSIDESRAMNSKAYTIELCKYMTYMKYPAGKAKAGQIIIPDGSGAVMQFNSPKGEQYAAKYPEKRVYGNDSAINISERGNASENIMFGMYAFLETEEGKGLICIVDKGAAQMSFNADIQRNDSTFNYAYFKTYLREIERVSITTSATYVKTSYDLYQGDIKYSYYILTGDYLSYNDVANKYRKYLVDKYDLVENDETTVANPTITFIGAYEKKTLKAGVVRLREYSLTSFEQAINIVRELRSRGVSMMNVAYRSWTEDDADQKTTTKINVSNVLGDNKGLKKLTKYLKDNMFDFYPEYRVSIGKGYNLFMGSLKYSSKSISGSYSTSLGYVLSTGLENKNARRGQFVSPIYYNSLVSKYLKNYNKLGIDGIYLSDLGNLNIADYSKNVQVYSAGGSQLQRDALSTVKEDNKKVMLKAPYDYAFEYTDVATVVPVTTTLYGIVDYSIPLYQLVASGLFDYSSKPVNYNNEYSYTWNLLKDIETGSNPAFVLASEDTNALLDTQYTEYYNSYYVNWKEKIANMVQALNATGIYASRLVSHEYLTDNVVRVKYANGLTIIINYDNENYYDYAKGLVVASNWFAIISEGGN